MVGHLGTLSPPFGRGLRVPIHSEISPLQVFLSGCSMKPTGQLQWTPVAASWHLLSQPPLLTAQVSVEGSVGGNRVTSLEECQTQVWGLREALSHLTGWRGGVSRSVKRCSSLSFLPPLTSAGSALSLALRSLGIPAPYLIETRWAAVRQVQARAVRQECAGGGGRGAGEES